MNDEQHQVLIEEIRGLRHEVRGIRLVNRLILGTLVPGALLLLTEIQGWRSSYRMFLSFSIPVAGILLLIWVTYSEEKAKGPRPPKTFTAPEY